MNHILVPEEIDKLSLEGEIERHEHVNIDHRECASEPAGTHAFQASKAFFRQCHYLGQDTS